METYYVGLTQYQVDHGSVACTAIGLVGAYYCVHRGYDPGDMSWRSIVKRGAKLWACCKSYGDARGYLTVEDIYKAPCTQQIRSLLPVRKEFGGSFDAQICEDVEGFYTIGSIVSIFSEIGNPPSALLFTFGSITVLVVYTRNRCLWLFDSHGDIFVPTKSVLISFQNIRQLETYLNITYNDGVVFSVVFFSKETEYTFDDLVIE